MSKQKEKQVVSSAPKGARTYKTTINGKSYTLSYGVRAHWFVEREYNISFSGVKELISDPKKDPLLVYVYLLHGLLHKEHPKLTLEDVFDLVDSMEFIELLKVVITAVAGEEVAETALASIDGL